MWFEELPTQCPPSDAVPPNTTCFRLINSTDACCKDFWSHRELWPDKVFNVTECVAKSVSVFSAPDELLKLKKLPAHKKKSIAEIQLKNSDGLIKKTGKKDTHYSWWRSASFELSTALVSNSQ